MSPLMETLIILTAIISVARLVIDLATRKK